MNSNFFTKVYSPFFIVVFLVISLAATANAADVNILARQYVTNTVHIPGGNYPVPYNISTPNTEYILDGDISADGTAISINASKVVVNLNGHTITYNQTVPGEGVRSGSYNRSDIAIINGSIIQGAAMSEGGLYGDGINPIKTSGYIVARLQVANIYARIGGRDVAAFIMGGTAPLIENNTIEDTYDYGTLKDRHSGISILRTSGEYAIVRNNTIINCRHRGIEVTNYAQVYGNTISIRSIATNSVGIGGWAVHDVKVHDNIITGRGEHPIGIGFSGPPTTNIEVYNNTIDVQVTRLGCEYGGDPNDCTLHVGTCWTGGAPCATDNATGIRCHKEGHNVYVHDNTVTVRTDSAYPGTYSVDGASVMLFTEGRGIQIGGGGLDGPGSSTYENNTIYAMDKDGTGQIGGLVCDTNYPNSTLIARNNTVTSNLAPLVLGDGYGWCQGHPLFIQNTFIKSSDYAVTPNHPENFHTISAGLGGYYPGTGTLISNVYLNGAAENDLNMYFDKTTNRTTITAAMDATQATITVASTAGMVTGSEIQIDDEVIYVGVVSGNTLSGLIRGSFGTTAATHISGSSVVLTTRAIKSVIFGRLMEGTVQDNAAGLLPNVRVRTFDANNKQQTESVTDANGVAPLMVYDYELNNNGGTTGSAIPNSVTFRPHTIELFDQNISQALFTTSPDSSSSAWDALASSGIFTLGNTNGSITINTAVKSTLAAVPIQLDASAPSVVISSPSSASTVSGSVSVIASASDNVGVTKVEFYVNGVLQSVSSSLPYTFTWSSTAVANGTYILTAKAYDAVGNVGQSANASVTVNNALPDAIMPTATIITPASNATISGSVTVVATATDNVGVNRVEFYQDGTLRAAVNTSPYSFNLDTTALANGSHTLSAKAFDNAGNSNLYAEAVTVSNDTTDPTVTVTAPASNATVSGTVAVTATASDNVAVSKVEFYLNNALVSTSSVAPYSFSWDTTKATNGTYTLFAKAYDAAGNVGQSASVTASVSNYVPTLSVSITAPANNATISGLVAVSATVANNVGATKVDFYLNNSLLSSSTTAPYVYSMNTKYFANGSYTINAKVSDSTGSVANSLITVNVLNDKIVPTVSIKSPAASASVNGTVSVTTAASDNIGVTKVELYVNNSLVATTSTAPFTLSWNTLNYANGSYVLSARAYDTTGNIGLSANVTVNVANDKIAPIVSTFIVPTNLTTLTVPVTSFSASDNVAVTGYMITESATAPDKSVTGWSGTAPASYTFATTGTKSLYAWAKDAAGNVSAAVTATLVISIPKTVSQDVMIVASSTMFPTIQDAYNTVPDTGTIAAKDVTLSEQLNFNRAVNVNLEGGMDASFQSTTGTTAVSGVIKISKGKVVVSKISVR